MRDQQVVRAHQEAENGVLALGDIFDAIFVRQEPKIAEKREAQQRSGCPELRDPPVALGVAHVQIILPAESGDHLPHHLPPLRGAVVREHFLGLAGERGPDAAPRQTQRQNRVCNRPERQPHRKNLSIYMEELTGTNGCQGL